MLWCYGLAEDRPVLKVVNPQGYPVTLSFPRAWKAGRRQAGVLLPEGLGALVEQTGKTKTVLLSGGSSIALRPGVLTPGGTVTARSSGAGYLAMALALGLDTFRTASGGVPGAPQTSADVLTDVLEGDCLDRPEASVDTLGEAETVTLKAHSTAFGCLQKAWEKRYPVDGPAGDFTGVALTWLSSGIDVLLDGVTGVADAAVFTPPQTIRVQASAPSPQMVGLGAGNVTP